MRKIRDGNQERSWKVVVAVVASVPVVVVVGNGYSGDRIRIFLIFTRNITVLVILISTIVVVGVRIGTLSLSFIRRVFGSLVSVLVVIYKLVMRSRVHKVVNVRVGVDKLVYIVDEIRGFSRG